MPAALHLLKATAAATVERVGIHQLKLYHMESIKKFPRGILDQVISSRNAATVAGRRAPGPGLKPQATKLQAASDKLQAPSNKRQAPSRKLQAP